MDRSLIATMAIGLVLSACADTSPPVDRYPVAGVVTAGPTCPVVQDPPDPTCDDRAVASATLVILNDDGDKMSEVVTDAEGRFTVSLPAGRYTVEPQPVEGLLGTAGPQEFAAGPGLVVTLQIVYDTGIR